MAVTGWLFCAPGCNQKNPSSLEPSNFQRGILARRPPRPSPPSEVRQGVCSVGAVPRCVIAILLSLGGALWMGCKPSQSSDSVSAHRGGARTFNRDVASILFQHCAPCHRPGQAAPFSLLSYADALKHASEIAEVTQKRYMPPWLPERGYGEFRHERRLTAEQIDTIQKWVTGGASEGDPADRPGLPKFAEGWQLGEPDLIVQMPQPYTLPAV